MSYSFADHAGDEQDGVERAEARAEESLREQRWRQFRDVLADYCTPEWLSEIVQAYRERGDSSCFGPSRLAWHIQQFAEAEGWPGVLHAIGQAMQEEANARATAEVVEAQKSVR